MSRRCEQMWRNYVKYNIDIISSNFEVLPYVIKIIEHTNIYYKYMLRFERLY